MAMRPKHFTLTLKDPDRDGIAAAQQRVGAGTLTLNGVYASGGTVDLTSAHQISLYSAGNLSALTFTVVGTDENDDALTEAITGPNATTVESTGYFKTISSVSVSGTVGTDVEVGTVDEAITPALPCSNRFGDVDIGLGIDISGTINAKFQHTFDNILRNGPSTGTWHDHATLSSVTANASGNYSYPIMAVRGVVNSFTAGATITFHIIHS